MSAQTPLFTDIAGSVHEDSIDWLTREGPLTASDARTGSLFEPYEDIPTAHFKDWLGRVDDSTTDLPAAQTELPTARTVTRLQAAYVIAEFFDLPSTVRADHGFSDMSGSGYTTADHRTVWAVKDAGIMFGVTSTTFKPSSLLKRGQAASILYRGFKQTVTDPDNPCGDGFLPRTDGDGKVTGCLKVSDCPYDEYGITRPDAYSNSVYVPIWVDGPESTGAVVANDSITVTRRVVKCRNFYRVHPSLSDGWCLYSETNVGGNSGNCLWFRLSVKANFPSALARAAYYVDYCGHGSRPCESTDASAGSWTVALGALNNLGAAGGPYVDAPVEVSVTDWGDASELEITIYATSLQPYKWNSAGAPTDYHYPLPGLRAGGYSHGNQRQARFTVPRRSGPAPSDDMIDVNIADVARKSYADRDKFVEVLRSELLANDKCPAGTDCGDPSEWPVDADGSRWNCDRLSWATQTLQGRVGCDKLNSSYGTLSVRYWPELWATGEDSFEYSTYGGTATVTINFTDKPPDPPDITVGDPGRFYSLARYPFQASARTWHPVSGWTYRGAYSRAADESADHYTGAVSLASVRDSDLDNDLDASSLSLVGVDSSQVVGLAAVVADGEYPSRNLGYNSVPKLTNSPFCGIGNLCYRTPAQIFEDFVEWARRKPADTADGSVLDVSATCKAVGDTATIYKYSGNYSPSTASQYFFTATNASDQDCVPAVPSDCRAATLADWSMCYSAWPSTTDASHFGVDYRVCDARRAALQANRSDYAEYLAPKVAHLLPSATRDAVAGYIYRWLYGASRPQRSVLVGGAWTVEYLLTEQEWDTLGGEVDKRINSARCGDGTITVLLGDLPTVTLQPAATAAEGSPLPFTLSLDSPSAVDVTVSVSTAADAGAQHQASSTGPRRDYLPRSGYQVTIPAGDTTAQAFVFSISDTVDEHDETLRLQIVSAEWATVGAATEATGTITDNDAPPTVGITAGAPAVPEDDRSASPPSGGSVSFTVRLSAVSAKTATVGYDTVNGTATGTSTCPAHPGNSAEDYGHASGMLTYAPGRLARSVTIDLCPDDQREHDETLTVTLTSPADATLGTASAAATILDNDDVCDPPYYRWDPDQQMCVPPAAVS